MIIYTIRITGKSAHCWYRHLLNKEVDVVKTKTSSPFRGEYDVYKIFNDKTPIRFILIDHATIISERKATKQEMYSGTRTVSNPKGRTSGR